MLVLPTEWPVPLSLQADWQYTVKGFPSVTNPLEDWEERSHLNTAGPRIPIRAPRAISENVPSVLGARRFLLQRKSEIGLAGDLHVLEMKKISAEAVVF